MCVTEKFTPAGEVKQRLRLKDKDVRSLQGSFVVYLWTGKSSYAIAWKTANGIKTGLALWRNNDTQQYAGAITMYANISMDDVISRKNKLRSYFSICLDCSTYFAADDRSTFRQKLTANSACFFRERDL